MQALQYETLYFISQHSGLTRRTAMSGNPPPWLGFRGFGRAGMRLAENSG
jgi:hypothetical protein